MTGWIPDSWRSDVTPDVTSDERCGSCDRSLSVNGPSRYFCGQDCQSAWQAKQVGAQPMGPYYPFVMPIPPVDPGLGGVA